MKHISDIKSIIAEKMFLRNSISKCFLMVILLLMIASLGYCEEDGGEVSLTSGKLGIDIWSNYTTLEMKKFDKLVELDTNTNVRDGVIIGIDVDYFITPVISIGPRVSYLKTNEGKNTVDYGDGYNRIWKHKLNLTSFLIGAGYVGHLTEVLTATAKVYLGYGKAKWQWISQEPFSADSESNFTGKDFITDLSFSLDYFLTEKLKLGGFIAYQFAEIDEIKSESGETFPVTLDFSGPAAGLKLGYLF